MHTPALVWLADYSNYSDLIIGKRAKQLAKLHSITTSIPLSFCVPLWTLKTIADANNLRVKCTHLLRSLNHADPVEKARIEKQVAKLLKQTRIPESITTQIAQAYQQHFAGETVSVYPSNSSRVSHQHTAKGEANVVDSIVAVWEDMVIDNLQYSHASDSAHDVLFSSPILVEQKPTSSIRGVAHTSHPQSPTKAVIVVEVTEQVPSAGHSARNFSFHFDVRTKTIVGRHSNQHQHTTSKLSDSEISNIALLTHKIKQRYINQISVNWVWNNGKALITEVTPSKYVPQSNPITHNRTITKVYISAGNPTKAQEFVTPHADGVGVLRSEYTVAQLGIHPAHVAKSRHKKQLKEALVHTMLTYKKQLQDRPLIYRSYNLTSDQLRQLQYAESYEPSEANPFLGFRGGMRMLAQSGVFDLELGALKEVLETHQTSISLLLPYVRSQGELHKVLNLVRQHQLLDHPNFSVWLQLNTPQNVLQLQSYAHPALAGFVINCKSLDGLLAGYDPDDPQLRAQYADADLLLQVITHALRTLRTASQQNALHLNQQLFVHMEDYSSHLLQKLVTIGIDGVVVKPAVAPLAKTCIMEKEAARLADSHT